MTHPTAVQIAKRAPTSKGARSRWLRGMIDEPVTLLMALAVVVLAFLVLYPVFWLFIGSFVYGDQSFSQVLQQFWSMPGLQTALANTALLVAGTVPLAFLFALPLAWITARTDTPLRGLIGLAALLPFITPPLIGAVAWSLLGAPRTGLINVAARQLGANTPVINIYGMGGLIFVSALYLSPFIFVATRAALERMDSSLEEASAIAGGGAFRTMRHVLLPLLLPALASSGIIVLTRAMEEFAIPGVLGAPAGIYTLTTYIFYRAISYMPPRYGVAALLAIILMLLTALALWAQARILGGGRRFTTVAGRGQRPRRLVLGAWRYVTMAYALLYLFLAIGLPYLVLIYGAFIRTWGLLPTPDNLTLVNIVRTFDPALIALSGLGNSVVLALCGATATSVLMLMISYMIVTARPAGRAALDVLSSIPLAMPGPVMAVAMLWAYLNPPFVLYGTLGILGVAYVTAYLPYGARMITTSFRQLSPEFERAASVCGAGRFARFRDILFPLVLPGVLAGWMLMFVAMVRELSASVFLFVPGTETAAVALLSMWQEGMFSNVCVLSLVIIALSVTVIFAVTRWSGKAGRPTGAGLVI
jgi:iron(III) transport system permease protein